MAKKQKALSKKDKAFVKKLIKQTIKREGLMRCDERLQQALKTLLDTLIALKNL